MAHRLEPADMSQGPPQPYDHEPTVQQVGQLICWPPGPLVALRNGGQTLGSQELSYLLQDAQPLICFCSSGIYNATPVQFLVNEGGGACRWVETLPVDIRHSKDLKVHRMEPKSQDIYLWLLVKLYRFLARRSNAPFNKVVLKQLFMNRTNRPPLSLARLICKMEMPLRESKTAAVVGSITDAVRIWDVPKLKVCTLRVTDGVRHCILKARGQIMTFDQLVLAAPKGHGTVLLSGPRKGWQVYRHFGFNPGTPHSHTKPFISSKGRKFEGARGRRPRRGYKN
ncbi:large ribosomal subunit protein eL18-like [Heterodontus francisci]|uniref:large ribosomal subunit protein eL18-like n=1 Tax=Heterodontus francisci TaxID=7792 RepID=UPI00355AFC66